MVKERGILILGVIDRRGNITINPTEFKAHQDLLNPQKNAPTNSQRWRSGSHKRIGDEIWAHVLANTKRIARGCPQGTCFEQCSHGLDKNPFLGSPLKEKQK